MSRKSSRLAQRIEEAASVVASAAAPSAASPDTVRSNGSSGIESPVLNASLPPSPIPSLSLPRERSRRSSRTGDHSSDSSRSHHSRSRAQIVAQSSRLIAVESRLDGLSTLLEQVLSRLAPVVTPSDSTSPSIHPDAPIVAAGSRLDAVPTADHSATSALPTRHATISSPPRRSIRAVRALAIDADDAMSSESGATVPRRSADPRLSVGRDREGRKLSLTPSLWMVAVRLLALRTTITFHVERRSRLCPIVQRVRFASWTLCRAMSALPRAWHLIRRPN